MLTNNNIVVNGQKINANSDKIVNRMSDHEKEMLANCIANDPDSDKKFIYLDEHKEKLVLAYIFYNPTFANEIADLLSDLHWIDATQNNAYRCWLKAYKELGKIPNKEQYKTYIADAPPIKQEAYLLFFKSLKFVYETSKSEVSEVSKLVNDVVSRQRIAQLGVQIGDALTSGDLSEVESLGEAIANAAQLKGGAKSWGEIKELQPMSEIQFPIDALACCPAFKDLVEEVSHNLQIDPAVTGTIGLSVLSTALARFTTVEIRPNVKDIPIIWGAAGLPPSDRKTPALNCIDMPLKKWESNQIEESKLDLCIASGQRKAAPDRQKEILNSIRTNGGKATPEQYAELGQLQQLLDSPEPEAPQVLVDDATPEALASFMQMHNGQAAVIASEAQFLEVALGRYSQCPAIEIYLSSWSGVSTKIIRKGAPPVHLEKPLLILGLCIQPEPLHKMFKDQEASSKGFGARFLACLPNSLVGSRKVISDAFNQEVQLRWNKLITDLLENPKERNLVYSAEAFAQLLHYEEAIEPRLHPKTGDLHLIGQWVGKAFPGQLSRVAALLHIASGDPLDQIQVGTVEAAHTLIQYYLLQAKLIARVGSEDKSLEIAKRILDKLKDMKVPRFKRSYFDPYVWEVRKSDKEILGAAYQRLIAANIIRAFGVNKKTGETKSFEINPLVQTMVKKAE